VLLTLDQIRQTRIGKREVLQKTGIKDPQSSAYTSECFADFGARQIEASKRHDHRLSIATLVIRNWEALLQNVETAVHARLAARLVEVALECVRASDMIARIEPGQYAVLFTETSNLGALVATRRLLEMLQSDPQIQAVETEVPLGPTIGVASFPNDGKDIGTLMRISRERAFSRQRSLLGRLNLQTFEFWSTFDALLGSREDLGANELPRSALDRKETGLDKPSESFAHVLMSEAQAQCISRLLLQEICLRNGVPGVCYIHAGLLARADELDLANSRTVVHVLRPKGEWPQTPSGAADIPIDDPRLDDSRFVLFLGEFQWYGLIVRRIGDDLVWGLHFSDIGTVDELVNQLQKQYHLQRNLL
jgi:GGDEF domain-containing protein